jgi:CDP-alcohol phosphatidyltransferase
MPQAVVTKTISELKKDCQQTHYSWNDQPWLFRQFREVSIYLTWALLHTRLTPNAITLVAIAGGVLTGALFAFGYWITGVITLLIVVLLDFSDGEVSRYHGTQSKEGSYLDKIYIFTVHPSPFAGMALGIYGADPTGWVLAAGFINVISAFLLCMVTEYALQIALWKHSKRFIDRLNRDPAFLAEQLQMASSRTADAESAAAPRGETSFDDFRNSRPAVILKRIASGWDFPYIFCFMSLAIVLQLLIGERNSLGVGPAKLFLYFYAITYPPLICFMLLKNVATKLVERQYAGVSAEIMQMVEKARRT